jgi:hypothetical protein
LVLPLNRFEILALLAAFAFTLLCVNSTISAVELYLVWQDRHFTMYAIALVGWLLASYGPIFIATTLWRGSKCVESPWLLHIAVLPGMFFAMREGSLLMLYAIDQTDFDSTIGAPVMTGIFLFLTAFVLYVAALISRLGAIRKDRAPPGHGPGSRCAR